MSWPKIRFILYTYINGEDLKKILCAIERIQGELEGIGYTHTTIKAPNDNHITFIGIDIF